MNPEKKHGFVLIPDDLTIRESIRLNEALPEGKLKLDKMSAIPHLTVLQTFFKDSFNYGKALKEIRSYNGFIREPRTMFKDITVEETQFHSHIVWWNVENSKWLKKLNSLLVEKFSDELVAPDDVESRVFRNNLEKESYRITGYERNLENYEPHITLGVLDEKPESLPETQIRANHARMRKIAFVEHGENGTVAKILDSLLLPMTWD